MRLPKSKDQQLYSARIHAHFCSPSMEIQWTLCDWTQWWCRGVGGHLCDPASTRHTPLWGISAQGWECHWKLTKAEKTLILFSPLGGAKRGDFMAIFQPSILEASTIIAQIRFYLVTISIFPETTVRSSSLITIFVRLQLFSYICGNTFEWFWCGGNTRAGPRKPLSEGNAANCVARTLSLL